MYMICVSISIECDSSSIDVGYEKILNEDSIKPHERRALNFLIYEYLLQQDCKLTSITFSDEVPEQVCNFLFLSICIDSIDYAHSIYNITTLVNFHT